MDIPAPLWWVSFADDDGNLGCCIIEAIDAFDVIPACWRAGCNPGGEAQFVTIPEIALAHAARYERGRLYSKAEITAIDGAAPEPS